AGDRARLRTFGAVPGRDSAALRRPTMGRRAAADNAASLAKVQEITVIHADIEAGAPAGSSCLFIGQNRVGQWVVRDARRLCGGLFANRTEAIRFAMYECQRRPQSVIMLPDGLELDGPLAEDPMSDLARRRAAYGKPAKSRSGVARARGNVRTDQAPGSIGARGRGATMA